MCKYASFVLTKDQVFWSETTESHEEIIREFQINECDSSKTRINILRVELSPTTKWADLSAWEYKVDQDQRPEWFDEKECEARTRKALKDKIDKALLKNFKLLDEFLAEIKTVKWLKQHRQPLKKWKIFYGKDLAAARAAAGAAAGDAARAAAGAAAWDAARDAAWDAARDAARDAAWAAAWAAAWDAARAAAGAAAWDAAGLQAQKIICTGLKIDPKHIKHIDERWDVWKRGYALLCDVNGVLYVYGEKK